MSNNLMDATSGATEAGLSAWGSVAAAAIAGVALLVAWHQLRAAARSAEAAAFQEIHRRWNEIYPTYRKLVREVFDPAATVGRHPDFATYADTEEWIEKRKLFSFYEFCGALIDGGHIHETTLFALVSYKPALWEKYGPLIKHYRKKDGGSDLYIKWESLDRRYCHSRWKAEAGFFKHLCSGICGSGNKRQVPAFQPLSDASIFGALAALRDKRIPDQRALSDKKKGYRDHRLDTGVLQADEPLVLAESHRLSGCNFYFQRRNPPHYAAVPGAIAELWVREGVAKRLSEVNRRLEARGLALWLFDAWRPQAVQAYFHDEWMPAFLKRHDPSLKGDALVEAVEKYWAAPTSDAGSPAPHSTGGAVDVTLCWLNSGERLWMGSVFDDVSKISQTDYFENPARVALSVSNEEARENRRLLHWVMTEAGFCAHPDEWWHFSYGDQMWARLTDQPAAFYGGVEPAARG